jgi:ribosomal protein L34E
VLLYSENTGVKMAHKLHKKMDLERCPNCQMPLEDVEVCNYCEWKSIHEKNKRGKRK